MPKPRPMADVLSELMSRRGYARVRATLACDEAWQQAAGELLARYTRVGQVKRGVLEVIAANSAVAQELSFQKKAILKNLTGLLPDQPITDLRCRVGPID